MSTSNAPLQAQLIGLLARQPGARAADLAAELGVSGVALHRQLKGAQTDVVTLGKARRTRYALRRALRGDAADIPVYQIDEAGRAELLAPLTPVRPSGTVLPLAGSAWPVPAESADGLWSGLPYPLQDMRPQGYMGRQFARAEHAALGVPADPTEWSDDDVLHALARTGVDVSGNLLLGDTAYARWMQHKLTAPEPLPAANLGAAYAALAERAVALGVPGSSAAGEFPKFAAQRALPGAATPHVLVKFSGADGSPAVQRWADLLVCEHLALECAATLEGLQAARSRILQHAGRTFLEVERFDRHGAFGRCPLVCMETVNAEFIGEATNDWPRLAARLVRHNLLSAPHAAAIDSAWWFGRLIANSDMHLGNLSFTPRGGVFTLAPLYDMLPMLYAPLPGGEVPPRSFEPPTPLPPQRPAWLAACGAAIAFWQRCAGDGRISEAFRQMCRGNGERLEVMAERV